MVSDDDEKRFALVAERLSTPLVGDILDGLGQTHRFLPPAIAPLHANAVIVGRAMPVVATQVSGPQVRPFGLLTVALDQLQPGEVYLVDGGGAPCAAWGEILTETARMRGAVGAVIHGYHRDTPKLPQDWPIFSRGPFAQDSSVRSAVTAYRVGIEIGGVAIEPGDLVVGDVDGVVIVPREIEDDVLARALDKASAENVVLAAIHAGMSSTAAFEQYRVL
jgi:regulator of RNase E activity RraA